LEYRRLYELWLEERTSSSLLKIPADFYISMDGKLAKSYRKVQNLEWAELADEIIERMEFLRKDLTQLRLAKILNSIIHNVHIDLGVTTWGERRLIENLRKSIETLGMEKPNILDTQENLPITNLQNKSDVESSQTEENSDAILTSLDNLMIRILSDVEAFVGLDNKHYGPLLRRDIVCLPVENAKALIARGMARAIETSVILSER
jgi:DNA replication initiation complex subunit (GINS family)